MYVYPEVGLLGQLLTFKSNAVMNTIFVCLPDYPLNLTF